MTQEKFLEMTSLERSGKIIAGADEAGRGPLAGPVVAAAVIMDDNYIFGVDDSKKISEKKRELLFEQILQNALAYGVGIVDCERIDEINILNATREAFNIAIGKLNIKPDLLVTDAIDKLDIAYKYESVIKGDAKIYSIAAASIIAKVTRDRIMRSYEELYPGYGFAQHKGYGTKLHCSAILEHGLCPIHRRSFCGKFI